MTMVLSDCCINDDYLFIRQIRHNPCGIIIDITNRIGFLAWKHSIAYVAQDSANIDSKYKNGIYGVYIHETH